jgi:hypothetical protein
MLAFGLNGAAAEDLPLQTGFGLATRLEALGAEFQALFLDTPRKDALGGLVLAHGAETAEVFLYLHKEMPKRGWRSLYLQSPFGAGAEEGGTLTLEDGVERIKAAVAWLKEKQAARIVLLGRHAGCFALARYLAQTPDPAVAAAVFLEPPAAESAELLQDLSKIAAPVLDIEGGRGRALDSPAARARAAAARGNAGYRQIVLADPSTRLDEISGLLANHIHGWLRRLAFAEKQAAPAAQ